MKKKIIVEGKEISIQQVDEKDYVSLTDMVRDQARPDQVIGNWLRTLATLDYLATWEKLYNPDFKPLEFEGFRRQAGRATFTMSVKEWTETTGAIGMRSKSGRGGGTFAHRDIAFHFGETISPLFHLLLIREFDRLKAEEMKSLSQGWDFRRFLSKVNYPLQTEAIRQNLLPRLAKGAHSLAYATEADILNLALFGMTAKQWREANPEQAVKGNIRDFASALELTVLSNLESFNAQLIRKGAGKESRLEALADMARFQLGVFTQDDRLKVDE